MLPGAAQCERSAIARGFRKELTEWGWELNDPAPHISGVIGSAFHAGVAYMLYERMNDPEKPATLSETARLTALVDFRERLSKHEKGVQMEEDGLASNVATAEDQLFRMLEIYTGHLNTLPPPVMVEQKIQALFRPGVIARGTFDQVTVDRVLRDHKSGSRVGWYKPQVGLYQLILESNGEPIEQVAIDFMQRTKKKRPSVLTQVYDLADAAKMAWSLTTRIADGLEKFSVEQDPQVFNANPCAMFCDAAFCTAYKTQFCKAPF